VKSSEFKRWLVLQGAIFKPGKGGHLRVELNGRISVLPMHSKDMKNRNAARDQETARTEIGDGKDEIPS
jgi:mRNA interferase HicA